MAAIFKDRRNPKIAVTKKKIAEKRQNEKALLEAVEEGQRDYELTLIVNPELSEDSYSSLLGKITKEIQRKGGEVTKVEQWGKRRMAYPIKRFLEGIYTLLTIKAKPSSTGELIASLRINEDVLRYMLISIEAC